MRQSPELSRSGRHWRSVLELAEHPVDDRRHDAPFSHVPPVKYADRLRVTVVEAEVNVVNGVLHIVAAVHAEDWSRGLIEQALIEQGNLRAPVDVILERLAPENLRSCGHEVHEIGGGVARARLPFRREGDVNAARPVDGTAE